MQSDRFLVAEARNVSFGELSPKLKHQFAFRHFYTNDLDPAAGDLSVKFLSLAVLYFCSIFKLEGRRRQYEERPSTKSGKSFASAHRRAQAVFQQLAATYSVIIMRYSWHNVIEYVRRAPNRASGSGGGMTQVKIRQKAFQYESDELVFFEILYQITADVVRMAFAGDATVQELAVEETNKLFRSKTFLFQSQHRAEEVRRVTKELDSKAATVLENTTHLAELLIPSPSKICGKYANVQRTPFLACQLPGGTSVLRYQRVHKGNGQASVPTAAEKMYKVEMTTCTFDATHRAMLKPCRDEARGLPSSPSAVHQMGASTTSATWNPAATRAADGGVASPDLERLRGGPPSPTRRDRPASTVFPAAGAQSGKANASVSSLSPQPQGEDSATAEFEAYLARPAIEWQQTDLMDELAAIYQALANGVIVTEFSVPLDLKLQYDAEGHLLLSSLPTQ